MNFKFFLLLTCLLATTFLGANNNPTSAAFSTPASFEGGPCNLPAPFGFQITEVGTTWVKYEWGGNANAQHRLRTYRASDNALLNTTIVPIGNASAVISNIPTGTEVYGIINAICSNGDNSPNEAQSAPKLTLILELIVNGVQPPEWGGGEPCVLISPGYCPFSSNPLMTTSFRVSNWPRPTSSRIFGMKYTGSSQFDGFLQYDNSEDNSLFDFRCQHEASEPTCGTNDKLEIWFTGAFPAIKIAEFSPSFTSQTISKLIFSTLESGYQIERLNTYAGRPSDPSIGRNHAGNQDAFSSFASPNPFSESLEVFPAQPNAEKIHLQLYNLSGQKVLDQKFTGGQDQYSLPTAALSPGFYLLRVEADGEVQNLKVIKSE